MGKKESVQDIDNTGKISLLHPPKKIPLHDAHAIRREMANIYRDMRKGEIETQEGTRLAYVLNMLQRAYEASVLQEKIESIETVMKIRKNNEEFE